ncbi:MarR family winged helix-turn-helix transcriptional regulator [Microbacterium sp. SSM24]|uniref:MarR family winged helix-turn-helix transcriptional regulator n=1 Tax=Microbacterium sp. SSM24 TaxID=2991714 RepID=UPI0022265F97|nr:MarR family transcriptional regulator [Microbacterium sp. SSM24]MCW3491854.1 MarR family transcriptional regulator [Microbacterium sp. SSM24]
MTAGSGYWYGEHDDAARRRAIEVLESFRLYRAADAAMRRRTRDAMAMGENDLLTLRYLLKAEREGRIVQPAELSRYLGVSTASTTAIIDRLEKSGHVRRAPHPTDRRAIVVIPTAETDHEVRRTLGAMHTRMLEAVVDMPPEHARIVIECLARMQSAVDLVQPAHEVPRETADREPGDAASAHS